MSGSRKRAYREQHRELTRDEVWVGPHLEGPEESERDNALFHYRLIKRTGPVGRILVAAMLLALTFALVWSAYQTLVRL